MERAAARIAAALKSGGFEATFPRRFTWPMKFLRILPQPLRFWFINRATGWSKRRISGRGKGLTLRRQGSKSTSAKRTSS